MWPDHTKSPSVFERKYCFTWRQILIIQIIFNRSLENHSTISFAGTEKLSWNGIQTHDLRIRIQYYTNWAIKPTRSRSLCVFKITHRIKMMMTHIDTWLNIWIPEKPSQLFTDIPVMVFHHQQFKYIGLNTSRDVAKTGIYPIRRNNKGDRVSIEENKNLVSRKYAYFPFISFQTACVLIFRFSCQLLARLRNHWTAYTMEWRPRWSCWRLQTVVRTVRVNVWCWQLTSRICRWHKHTKQQYSLCKPSLLSLAVENQGLIVANENWSSGLPSRGRWTSWKSRMSHRPSGVVGFYLLHIMLR